MKLTKNNKRAKGMTLLELTVVILVLLSLISVLFIGARAWKKGSDRAASILTIRNVQQAVRSFSNMYGHNAGDTVATHPAGGDHVFAYVGGATLIPAVGDLYIHTTGTDATEYNPADADIQDW